MEINVYLCDCGENIAGLIDQDKILKELSPISGVKNVKRYDFLCSGKGIQYLEEDIKKDKPTHVVVAACTPKKHEITFRRACKAAGLNPYLLHMVNVREHCAWVTKDKDEATHKATALIKAGIERVKLQEPLEEKEIDLKSDILIMGGGVAGVEGALVLSNQDRKIYLVEKSPCIGGAVAKFEEVCPTLECSPCMVAAKLQEVQSKPNINILTNAEVEEVLGSVGNFIVKVKQRARYVDIDNCIGCGACYEVCPIDVKNEYNEGIGTRKAIFIPYAGSLPNVATIDANKCLHLNGEDCSACQEACAFEAIKFDDEEVITPIDVGGIIVATGGTNFNPEGIPEYGYKKIDNIFTGMKFERIFAKNGPTEGEITLKNGNKPKSAVIIHCVGRDELDYCSGICCMGATKYANFIKEQCPDAEVYNIHTDIVLPGRSGQKFFEMVKEKGINFVERKADIIPKISQTGDAIQVTYRDTNNDEHKINTDMVILACAMTPSFDADNIAKMLELSQDESGFFEEEHEKLSDYGTVIEGVFIAGCAQEPKNIEESVSQAVAATGRLQSKLEIGGKLKLEPIVAYIDEDVCGACKLCISLCPYKAISFDEEKNASVVNEALCKGCGTCGAACPTGAITSKHFTGPQIFAEIKEVTAW